MRIIILLLGIGTVITVALILLSSLLNKKNDKENFRDKRLFSVSPPSHRDNSFAPLVHGNINVYLINMRKNMDRYKRFRETFAKSDLKDVVFTRIEGVNGRALDLRKYMKPSVYKDLLESEKNGYRKHHYQLTRGAVGCYLAHMNCYYAIRQQAADYALIMEDDVRIMKPESLFQDIQEMAEQIPTDWDILLLGCVCFVCGKFRKYYDVNRYFLMHGYLIKKTSAEKIIHLLEKEPIDQQIDAKFSDLAEKELLKIYCLRDKLTVQWDMGTNVQIPVKNIQGINPFDSMNNL